MLVVQQRPQKLITYGLKKIKAYFKKHRLYLPLSAFALSLSEQLSQAVPEAFELHLSKMQVPSSQIPIFAAANAA